MPRRKRLTPEKRRKKPQVLPDEPDNCWHEIRGILDERVIRGRTEYLIDWEPSATTGQVYEPSWQPEVTEAALDEWEAKKAGVEIQSSQSSSGLPEPEAEPESQESQAPRPANWRSLKRFIFEEKPNKRRQSSVPGDSEPIRKKQRLERTASPSAPSITTTASSADSSVGSPQVSQQVYLIETDPLDVAVVLQKDPDFDPTEFQSVSGTNTQSTGFSSQSLSQLEGDTQVVLVESPLNSRQTVPDSQDLSVSSVSLPHQASLPQNISPRVIADSQAESQGLAYSQFESPVAQDCVHRGTVSAPGEHTPHIPSGQESLRDDTLPSCALAYSQSEPSVRRTNTYQSQAPLSPFQHSLAPSSHAIAETPLQSKGVNPTGAAAGGQPQDSVVAEHQEVFNSQLSQAAQITAGGSEDLSASVQSLEVNTQSVVSQTSSAAAASSKSNDRPTSGQTSSNKALSSPIHLATTMEGSQQNPAGSRRSADDELHDIFDLNAAGTTSEKPALDDELDNIFNLDMPSSTTVPPQQVETHELVGSLTGTEGPPNSHVELTIQSQPRETQLPMPEVTQSLASGLSQTIASQVNAAPEEDMSGTLRVDMPLDEPPQGTITPSDILRSAGMTVADIIPSMEEEHFDSLGGEMGSSRQPPPMGQGEQEAEGVSPEPSLEAYDQEELVTLPFNASARDEYMRLVEAYRESIQQYSRHFDPGDEDKEPPPEPLIQQIDDLFRALQNACDYPMDLIGTSLEELGAVEKTKYARDANSKFNFLFELLQGLKTDTRILIVARSADLLRLISYVTEALEIEYVCDALEIHKNASSSSAATVRLALPSDQVTSNDFDLIVGFDNSLSNLTLGMKEESPEAKAPLTIRLVITHAIDHIDCKVAHDIVPLERRQAIIWAIVMGRHLVSDPERGYKEPYEVAKSFYDFLNGDTEDIDWEPVTLPDDLLMVCIGSQGQDVAPAAYHAESEKGLKRQRDEEDLDEAKRLKTTSDLDLTIGNQNAPVSDEVQDMLDAVSIADDALAAHPTTVSIHRIVLQMLAEKFAELYRQQDSSSMDEENKKVIEAQAKQLQSYKRSMNKIYASHRSALEDRNLFERKMKDAEQKLRDAEAKAEKAVDKNTEKLQLRIAALEADNARLLGKDQEGSEETPLAVNEKHLKEAQEKVTVLEKRLTNAREEGDYIREQYRLAQSAAGEAGQLRAQLEKAEEEAAKNKIRIHEINAANSTRGYLTQISQLETQLRERTVELDRTREELRVSKNGRRETRQSSVPRSPRMGMLSPRAPARSYPSSTSRGGSPVPVGMDVGNIAGGTLLPGMQFLPQTPVNGRWAPH
ncbi:hypothetical protein LIA77_02503 [Sarocladium implicatum]|nr:hypothetical protein LIA77_02503 [Sarocladium implicatum]